VLSDFQGPFALHPVMARDPRDVIARNMIGACGTHHSAIYCFTNSITFAEYCAVVLMAPSGNAWSWQMRLWMVTGERPRRLPVASIQIG
jgi:hypothetical protein